MKVKVDRKLCNGDQVCTALCPEVFTIDEEGIATIQVDKVPEELEGDVVAAVESCPEQCLSIDDENNEG
jgi:ferredoxin